jgi:hypothetical protein
VKQEIICVDYILAKTNEEKYAVTMTLPNAWKGLTQKHPICFVFVGMFMTAMYVHDCHVRS